jgi:hypothetical protein
MRWIALLAVVLAQIGYGLASIEWGPSVAHCPVGPVVACNPITYRPLGSFGLALFFGGIGVSGVAALLGILRSIAGGPLRIRPPKSVLAAGAASDRRPSL